MSFTYENDRVAEMQELVIGMTEGVPMSFCTPALKFGECNTLSLTLWPGRKRLARLLDGIRHGSAWVQEVDPETKVSVNDSSIDLCLATPFIRIEQQEVPGHEGLSTVWILSVPYTVNTERMR